MAEVLKVIEVMSQSPEGFEDAIAKGVAETSKTVRNIRSAYVKEMSTSVKDGKVDQYVVNLKVTFGVGDS